MSQALNRRTGNPRHGAQAGFAAIAAVTCARCHGGGPPSCDSRAMTSFLLENSTTKWHNSHAKANTPDSPFPALDAQDSLDREGSVQGRQRKLIALQSSAADLLQLTQLQLKEAIKDGSLQEICRDQ